VLVNVMGDGTDHKGTGVKTWGKQITGEK
jgi:hypothetical protein